MSSWVLFKFKSSKEPTRITFDGTGITVFELKREIINVSGLGDGTDFDLLIYDEASNEEYDDDTAIVPRSSMVVARRLPAARAGHGKAARYVSGKMPTAAKNNYRGENAKSTSSGASGNSSNAIAAMSNAQTEQEKIAAMFDAEGDQWEQQQQQMANAKPVYNKIPNKKAAVPDRPPPQGYVCFRCGEKGHWIYACPTNDDPNFDVKHRIKRTTGIPRSFMKRVENTETAVDENGDDKPAKGYMIDPDGNRVIVQPDTASWAKFEAKHKASAAKQEAEAEINKDLLERGLECPIDHRLFEVPTKTPCCGKTYCHDCIEDALVNNDLRCPNCGTENVLIDNILPDSEMAVKIKAFQDEKAAEQQAREAAAEKEAAEIAAKAAAAKAAAEEIEAAKSPKENGETESKSPVVNKVKVTDDKDDQSDQRTPSSQTKDVVNSEGAVVKVDSDKTNSTETAAKSPSPTHSVTSTSSKKRQAEEELKNDRVPAAPSSMNQAKDEDDQKDKKPAPGSFDAKFIEDMEKISSQGIGQAPGFPNPMGFPAQNDMMNMPNMMGMPGMGNMAMNQPNMMGMGGMYSMMGMPNNNMPNNNMPNNMPNNIPNNIHNNMANPMMMMQHQQQNGGWGGQMGYQQQNFGNGQMGMTPNGGYGNQGGGWQGNQGGWQQNRQYPIQNGNFGGYQRQGFNREHPNEEDNAYFRQPVNPHRHQNRQKRLRPSDYTEL